MYPGPVTFSCPSPGDSRAVRGAVLFCSWRVPVRGPSGIPVLPKKLAKQHLTIDFAETEEQVPVAKQLDVADSRRCDQNQQS
eukprot:COSAG02_NODE_1737_length_11150_cov_15.164420_4_plen_82_part_00